VPTLFDRIYAVEAASAIANTMGDVTEGMSYLQIDEKYGLLEELPAQDFQERFRPQDWGTVFHYKAHHRPPGMTEDGQERHRLVTTAIVEKGGRISVDDLARTWARDIDPTKFGYLLGPQDEVIYRSILAGMPPSEIGRYALWPGFIGTGKMMAPIGCVNAYDPVSATRDARDVARLKDVEGRPGNYAIEVAAGIAAGIAEALKPSATVQSVLDTALGQLSNVPRQEVEMGLGWAREQGDWRKLRPLYADRYQHARISNAVEVLSSALAIFILTGPDPRECIVRSVNFGRDCDCRAFVVGTFAAAMAGPDAFPAEWLRTIDDELKDDPYTVSRRSLRESTQGIHNALLNELGRARERLALVDSQSAPVPA
jgi:ADP-ribosylglycohydrolase